MKEIIATVKFCFLLAAFFYSNATYTQTTIYPVPEGLKPSADYKVYVNGKEAFVYASPVPAAYCSFEMSGPVDIIIKANRDIKWVDVRPLAGGIQPVFKDSTIHFHITKPSQLSIELNGSIKTPLFIFANAPEKNKPSKNDNNVIFFEAGKIHYPGIINLNSNQTVYIEGGAVVVGVIKATDAKHIKIAGRGVLNGTYNNRFADAFIRAKSVDKLLEPSDETYQRFIELTNCNDVNIEGVTLHNSTSWQVVPVNSRNVHISNIKIVSDHPSDDGIDIVHSKNVLIENCFIRTKDDCIAVKAYMKKTDYPGKDSVLMQSPNVYKTYPITKIQDVDSVLVRGCVFWNALWGNALEIGFELNGVDVKNIAFRNCDIIHVEAGAVISIHNAGTSTVRNILFENIRIEDARQKLFDFAIFRSRYSEDGAKDENDMRRQYLNGAWDGVLMVSPDKKEYHAQFRGHIKNVVLRNIQITSGLFPFSVFYGFDDAHKVENISVENLMVYGKKINRLKDAKLYKESVRNITVK